MEKHITYSEILAIAYVQSKYDVKNLTVKEFADKVDEATTELVHREYELTHN